MKTQHYQEIMEHEEEVWDVVQAKVGQAVSIDSRYITPNVIRFALLYAQRWMSSIALRRKRTFAAHQVLYLYTLTLT